MESGSAEKVLDEVRTDYDRIAEHFSHTRMDQWYEVSYLVEQYIQPGQQVVDLGCGNGRVADLVAEIKANYLGLDISEKLIAVARTLRPGFDFRVGNLLKTGFPDQSFDHVLLIASLHHIPSEELRVQALEEARRLVRPQGFIIMTNWNLHQWRFATLRWKFNLRGLGRQHDLDWNDVRIPWYDQQRHLLAQRYYHAFTPNEIKHLAKSAELEVVDQYYETNGLHVPRRKGQNLVTVLRPR